jgi:hypothetical protein
LPSARFHYSVGTERYPFLEELSGYRPFSLSSMPETVKLSDPRSPLQIEYSRAAMEQIRKHARDGLMAAPRVGMGVGGLLLGVREGASIQLLDCIDIPCSHAAGPSFNLSADEKRESTKMIADAGAPDVSGKVGVIGWYCSKTRDDAILNQADRNLYNELFPLPWQIALVVRPNVVEPMRAAFFFRDENGAVVTGIECEVEEWRPAPAVESEAVEPPPVLLKPAPSQPVPAKVVEMDASTPKPVETVLPAATAAPLETAAPVQTRLSNIVERSLLESADAEPVAKPPVRPPAFFSSVPGVLAPPPRRNNIRLVLAIAAALLAVLAAAFITRGVWMPKPPLILSSSELNGTLLIHWNPEALRGVDHASMFVNDGGQRTPSLIPLDRFQLNSGLLSYTPKSQRVTAKLDAGETSAITAWFASTTPASTTPAPATP